MNREGQDGRRDKGLWWDEALSLVHGCTPVSEGCGRCWAAAASAMRAYHPNPAVKARNAGLTTGKPPRFNGMVRLDPGPLEKPARAKKPRVYAVWNDLFHEDVPFEFITDAFDAMCAWRWPNAAARREGDESALEDPGHTFVVLTKRPERIEPWLRWMGEHWPGDSPLNIALEVRGAPENVFIGTSFEDQPTADARMPHLAKLAAQGWRTVVSIEPMRGPVDMSPWLRWLCLGCDKEQSVPMCDCGDHAHGRLDGAILGGQTGSTKESGLRCGEYAVQMDPVWVRKVRDQCQAAHVPFYFKSWGALVPADQAVWNGKGRMLDGRTHDELAWRQTTEGDGT